MMDNKVFLSVVMPMFNSEKTIIKALDSLNNLKDKDIELILIDDGSEDESYEISREYLESVEFKHIIIKTENRGQSSARNIGIEKAKGEYILLLDSDDYISDNLVSVAKEASKRSNPEILMYDYQRVNEDYSLRENPKQKFAFFGSISPGMDVYEAYKNNDLRIWTSSLIYRTDFIIDNNLRFVEEAFALEDLNFIFKCLWTATKIKVIDEVLAYYYQRKDSLTNKVDINKNMTLLEAIDDLIGVSRKRVLGIDFERVIEREFAVEHIMYQILTALNRENKDEILKILKDKKVKEYLSEGVKKTPRYGNSLYIWSKIACYAPGLFTFLYLKKTGR
ncbi:MAG: glycosyltransferase family 2 protein [Sarcina sp.]